MDNRTARAMGAEYLIQVLLQLEAKRSPDLMPTLRHGLLETLRAPRDDEESEALARVSQAAYDIAFPDESPQPPTALRLAWPPQSPDGQTDS